MSFTSPALPPSPPQPCRCEQFTTSDIHFMALILLASLVAFVLGSMWLSLALCPPVRGWAWVFSTSPGASSLMIYCKIKERSKVMSTFTLLPVAHFCCCFLWHVLRQNLISAIEKHKYVNNNKNSKCQYTKGWNCYRKTANRKEN